MNLGRLDAKGWDLALRCCCPTLAIGAWSFGFDGTYTAQWDNDLGASGITHIAGTYNRTTACSPASAPYLRGLVDG